MLREQLPQIYFADLTRLSKLCVGQTGIAVITCDQPKGLLQQRWKRVARQPVQHSVENAEDAGVIVFKVKKLFDLFEIRKELVCILKWNHCNSITQK